METTETEVHLTPMQPELIIGYEGQDYLKEAGKWAVFLGIVGFVMCGLLLIVALFIGTLFSVLAKLSPVYSSIPGFMGAIFSIIIILEDVLYFFFALYLFQFGARIKTGIALMSTEEATVALGKLKSFFKLAGIVTIVMLCLLAFEVLIVSIVAVAAMSH